MRTLPGLTHEAALPGPVAGVDEAGRGAWAGPLVAAAVILNADILPKGLDDSKRLSAKRREGLLGELESCAVIGLGVVEAAEIDALGLTAANDLAMLRAVAGLRRRPTSVLIDGRRLPEGLNLEARALIGGDGISASIAAASIAAKVHRDRIMGTLAKEHPGYGWETSKGYGTAAHQAALASLGVSPQHRRCFRPISNILV